MPHQATCHQALKRRGLGYRYDSCLSLNDHRRRRRAASKLERRAGKNYCKRIMRGEGL